MDYILGFEVAKYKFHNGETGLNTSNQESMVLQNPGLQARNLLGRSLPLFGRSTAAISARLGGLGFFGPASLSAWGSGCRVRVDGFRPRARMRLMMMITMIFWFRVRYDHSGRKNAYDGPPSLDTSLQ